MSAAWTMHLHVAPCIALRAKMFGIVMSKWFRFLGYAMIVINTAIIATEHYPVEIDHYNFVTYWANTVLLCWFVLEMLMTICAFGLRDYVFFSTGSSSPAARSTGCRARRPAWSSSKSSRALRVLLLRRGNSSMANLIAAVVQCMIKATDILLLTFLIFYIYAIVGMQKYGKADLGCRDEFGGAATCYTNFSSYPAALGTLVQIVSGFSYTDLIGQLKADQTAEHSAVFMFLYFASFKFVSVHLCVNLFIVNVLDNFSGLTETEQEIDFQHFWAFTYAWADLTVGAHACPSMQKREARDFIRSLKDIVSENDQLSHQVAVKVTGFPAGTSSLIAAKKVRALFQSYGTICAGRAGVEPRMSGPNLAHFYVILDDLED